MKKVIGIIDQNGLNYDNKSIELGCGGSETWTIQISQEFSKYGYHVIVFNGTNNWHFDKFGVEWVPFEFLDHRLDYQQFDYIIITRIYEGLINKIEKYNCCDKVIIQSHDWGIGYWQPDKHNKKFPWRFYTIEEMEELRNPLLKKVIALSDWHKHSIMDWVHIPESMIEIIPNGIDPELFNGIKLPKVRDNSILWSSRPERGCSLLCDKILPLVKQVIPDFSVRIASYDPIQDEFKNRESEGIFCLGKLSKIELYEEMSKHAVWFYPSIYPETFNITSIESVLCGNMLVLPLNHGMATTFSPYKGFGMKNSFKEDYYIPNGNDELAIPEAVDKIIYNINGYNSSTAVYLRESMINYILNNYNWKNIVEKYVKLFKII